jgi:hypothetical protein
MSEIPNSYPEFLPQGPHSWTELRDAVLNNLGETINLIPLLPLDSIDLESLETVAPGTYRLYQRPDFDLLRELPLFAEGKREVGVFCIYGNWMITLGDGLRIDLPDTLKSIERDRLFQLDMHTHPGTDPGTEQPSDEDIHKLNSTIDGYQYIFNGKGILEYHLPHQMPGGFTDPIDVGRAWEYWVVQELGLSQEEYEEVGAWEVKRQFFEHFFGLKQIPWEDRSKIEAILDKGIH